MTSARLVFHLGDFKTGTTALQHWLADQAEITTPPGLNHASFTHHLSDPAHVAAHFGALAERLRRGRDAVVSSEHFEFSDPALLAHAIATHLPSRAHDLRLIAYVRPHGDGLLARFGESSKIGNFQGDLPAYLNWPQTALRLGYHARFMRWRAAFGDRFSLHLYDRADFSDGSIVKDFAAQMLGRNTRIVAVTANPSLGLRGLTLARAFHAAMGAPTTQTNGARWAVGRHLGRLLARDTRPDTPLLPDAALANDITARFEDDATALDRDFMTGTPMTDALVQLQDEALPAPQSLNPADYHSPDTLRMVTLFGQMVAHGLRSDAATNALEQVFAD